VKVLIGGFGLEAIRLSYIVEADLAVDAYEEMLTNPILDTGLQADNDPHFCAGISDFLGGDQRQEVFLAEGGQPDEYRCSDPSFYSGRASADAVQ
jgi:hypothetical protein